MYTCSDLSQSSSGGSDLLCHENVVKIYMGEIVSKMMSMKFNVDKKGLQFRKCMWKIIPFFSSNTQYFPVGGRMSV